jgi:hypothetical protein
METTMQAENTDARHRTNRPGLDRWFIESREVLSKYDDANRDEARKVLLRAGNTLEMR